MARFQQAVASFIVSDEGPTTVEYAVLLAFIVMLCLAAIEAVGGRVNGMFEETRDRMPQ